MVNINRTQAVEMMKTTKGRFFSVTFTKQDGSVRTMTCKYIAKQKDNVLGYTKVKEVGQDRPKNVNNQTIKKIVISGTTYKIK